MHVPCLHDSVIVIVNCVRALHALVNVLAELKKLQKAIRYLLSIIPFQLHITTAPTYFHFPPSGKRKPEDQYDVAR